MYPSLSVYYFIISSYSSSVTGYSEIVIHSFQDLASFIWLPCSIQYVTHSQYLEQWQFLAKPYLCTFYCCMPWLYRQGLSTHRSTNLSSVSTLHVSVMLAQMVTWRGSPCGQRRSCDWLLTLRLNDETKLSPIFSDTARNQKLTPTGADSSWVASCVCIHVTTRLNSTRQNSFLPVELSRVVTCMPGLIPQSSV